MNEPSLLSRAFLKKRPQAAATLLQDFTPEHCVEFLQQMPLEVIVPVIDGMASWPAARTLSLMPVDLTASILRRLPETETETLLRLMSAEQREAVIAHMPISTARGFANKLTYPLTTVGAWMNISVPCFTLDSSVEHCLDLVKRQKAHLGGIVIGVDDKRRVVGLVAVERLLTSDGKAALAELLDHNIQSLSARATLWEVENHEGWNHFPSLPVVDRNNTMLGALTHSALRAGTARATDRADNQLRLSLLTHIGRAFIVALSGLLSALTGIRTSPETRLQSHVNTPEASGGKP